MNDSILFLNDNFSESFKNKLSNFLIDSFENITGVIDIYKYDFQFIFGLNDLNLKAHLQYIYCDLDIVFPSSESINSTICWTSSNLNLSTLHIENVKDVEIHFFWTDNFPFEKIRLYVHFMNKRKDIDFNVEFISIPSQDIYLKFELNTDIDLDIMSRLRDLISKIIYNKNMNVYIGEPLKLSNNILSIHIDTYGTLLDIDELIEKLKDDDEVKFIIKGIEVS